MKRFFAGDKDVPEDMEYRYKGGSDIIVVRRKDVNVPINRFFMPCGKFCAMSISTGLLIDPNKIYYKEMERLVVISNRMGNGWQHKRNIRK